MLIDKPEDMPGWKSVRRRYMARIVANATGRCPSCTAIVGNPTEEAVQEIRHATIEHERGCGISDSG
jgi:hypothetical protein